MAGAVRVVITIGVIAQQCLVHVSRMGGRPCMLATADIAILCTLHTIAHPCCNCRCKQPLCLQLLTSASLPLAIARHQAFYLHKETLPAVSSVLLRSSTAYLDILCNLDQVCMGQRDVQMM